MKEYDISQEAQAAADWWCGNLGVETRYAKGEAKYGLVMSLEGQINVPEDKKEKFKQALINRIIERYPTFKRTGSGIYIISTDFEVSSDLEYARLKSEIKEINGLFPAKTYMEIQPGLVKVAIGQGKATDEIYKGEPKAKESQFGEE